MKGIIFNVLNALVEEKFGEEMWEKTLEKAQPASGGAYTAVASYPDEELFSIVGALSEETKIDPNTLVRVFGEFLGAELIKAYPQFTEGKNLKEFLLSIDEVVHVEVKKLNPDVHLPRFEYQDVEVDSLSIIYRSSRKLCHLAEGLIEGSAKYFGEKVEQKQSKCMHQGVDHCQLDIRFLGES